MTHWLITLAGFEASFLLGVAAGWFIRNVDLES